MTLNDCIMEKNYETLHITFRKPLAEIVAVFTTDYYSIFYR